MTNISTFKRGLLRGGSALQALALVGVVCAAATPAFAQDTAPQGSEAAPSNDTIVVTGSRIARPNLEGAAPVTTLSNQDFKLQGVTRTEDLLNNLPSVFAGQGASLSNGATGTATIDLRGLGPERTLVLVDGRRLMPGDPSAPYADLNFIPASLVKRVDVLTGGASTTYGADAVSGVVNFVMDRDFTGVRVDSQYSFYQSGDDTPASVLQANAARKFSPPSGNTVGGAVIDTTLVIGTGTDDGRGHVVGYVGYRKQNALTQAKRGYSFCSLSANSTASVAAGGNPYACGGSSTSATGRFFTNDPADTVGYNGGYTVNGSNFVPFTSANLYNFAPINYFQRPDERYTAGVFAHYEINEHFQPYLDAMFMDDRTVAQIAPSGDFGNTFTVPCDNPYLSAQQQGIICTPGNSAGTVTRPNGNVVELANLQPLRRNVEGGGRQDDLQHTDFRVVVGMKGDIDKAWSYDASYQFSRVNLSETYFNDFSITRLGRSLNVTTDSSGNPVCASVLDGTDANCVPYNIFSTGGVTPAALAYLQTPGFTRGNTQEQVFNASLTGELGEYGIRSPFANDGVAVNVGFEARKETLARHSDLEFTTGDLAGQGAPTLNIDGSLTVKEGFGELRVPLVQDKPFFRDLTFGTAYRYSGYKVAGNSFSTDTYKFELDWQVVKDLRLRGSYNRAVRAPNLNELFIPSFVALDGSTDPCAGTVSNGTVNGYTAAQCALTGVTAAQFGSIQPNSAAQYNGLVGGNTGLKPEKGTTYTFGAVFQPSFVPGLSVTADYFHIKIDNLISTVGADTAITTCLNTGDPTFCSLIHRDQFGSLWRSPAGYIVDTNLNIGSEMTSGVDIGVNYNFQTSSFGSFALNSNITYLDKLKHNNQVSPAYDCAGLYGTICGIPNPHWRSKSRVTWSSPWTFNLSLQWRYIGGVSQDTSSSNATLSGVTQPANLHLKSQSYFDLTASIPFADKFTFRLGVNNIFDKNPPIVGSNALTPITGNGNTYPQVYDYAGRYLFAGVTLNF